jgi:Fe-S-cluster containining protein
MSPTENPKPFANETPGRRGCVGCGTCCRKGGPAFHLQDQHLIRDGTIPLSALYTLRKGELARDEARGQLAPVADDIIKIQEKSGSWTCRFFDEDSCRCSIYPYRPLECRVLECWDTREILRVYDRQRLTRKDLVGAVPGLWPLVEAHQLRCDWHQISAWITPGRKVDSAHRSALKEMIGYDEAMRQLVAERGMDPRVMPFLFGRPLAAVLKALLIPVNPTVDNAYRR